MLRPATRSSSLRAGSFATSISRLETAPLPYSKLVERYQAATQVAPGPKSLAEKLVLSHLDEPKDAASIVRGKSYLKLRPGS